MIMRWWIIINLCCCLITLTSSSPWDPHVWPSTTPNAPPFFEGWYTRVTLTDGSEDSIAILFAASNLNQTSSPPNYISILHGDAKANTTHVYEAFPDPSSIHVTHAGKDVVDQPDWRSLPEFEWTSSEMTAVMEKSHWYINAEIESVRLTLEIEVQDWIYDGDRILPHSWTDVIQSVPLHWYVHSLSSRLINCRLESLSSSSDNNDGNGQQVLIRSNKGLAHMEKNYGRAFPKAWLWAEGVNPVRERMMEKKNMEGEEEEKEEEEQTRTRKSVAFVLSYGEVTHGIYTHFIHYRDEARGIAWDFKPDNSVLSAHEVLSCQGQAKFVLHGFEQEEEEEEGQRKSRSRRRLAIEMFRPNQTAGCLHGPTADGFVKLCEESFQGHARLTATLDGRLVGQHSIDRVAFELGGSLLCPENNACVVNLNDAVMMDKEGEGSVTSIE